MSTDAMIVIGLVVTSALAVTAHLAIAAGLLRRAPRWRALAALVVAPLAPFYAIREHMLVRAGIWIVGVAGYVAAWIASSA
jgi:hypothetical protein